MKTKKKLTLRYEMFLVLLLAAMVLTIGLINPAFFSWGTLFDVILIQTVFILMAFGLLPVVILGGVDISFVAIAALSTYPVNNLMEKYGYTGGIWLYYLGGIVIAILVGIIIAFLLSTFKLNIFDLSLAMNTLIYGFITFFIGSMTNPWNSPGVIGWNTKYLITVESVVGQSGLHISFLSILVSGILLHLLLRYTMIGRGIYAVGSDKSVAIRTGFNVRKIYMVVFPIMGIMAALAGVTNSILKSDFWPYLFIGKNMQVLAAVVLGGASTTGGKGTVFGTFLGAILIGLVSQALVYLGVDTQWYDAVVGIIFVVYATFQSLAEQRQ